MVAAWSVCILTLTPLDFDANLEPMEMATATFLGLPGVLIFREGLLSPVVLSFQTTHCTGFPGGHCYEEGVRDRLQLLRMSDKFSISGGNLLSQQKFLSVQAQHLSSCRFE